MGPFSPQRFPQELRSRPAPVRCFRMVPALTLAIAATTLPAQRESHGDSSRKYSCSLVVRELSNRRGSCSSRVRASKAARVVRAVYPPVTPVGVHHLQNQAAPVRVPSPS